MSLENVGNAFSLQMALRLLIALLFTCTTQQLQDRNDSLRGIMPYFCSVGDVEGQILTKCLKSFENGVLLVDLFLREIAPNDVGLQKWVKSDKQSDQSQFAVEGTKGYYRILSCLTMKERRRSRTSLKFL